MHRRDGSLHIWTSADPGAGVIHAGAGEGPAIVAARLYAVQLIAALWAVLVLPQLMRVRMKGDALRVAVPERVDVWVRLTVAPERVVIRDGAVPVQAQDLA